MDLAVPPSLLALVDELEAKRVIYSPLVCLNLWPYYGLIYFLGGGGFWGGGTLDSHELYDLFFVCYIKLYVIP